MNFCRGLSGRRGKNIILYSMRINSLLILLGSFSHLDCCTFSDRVWNSTEGVVNRQKQGDSKLRGERESYTLFCLTKGVEMCIGYMGGKPDRREQRRQRRKGKQE